MVVVNGSVGWLMANGGDGSADCLNKVVSNST
jgi:hypothetical protein